MAVNSSLVRSKYAGTCRRGRARECNGVTGFGTISALFGLTNRIIDQQRYTILVTAVIGSAVVPTLIAQRWFQPKCEPIGVEPAGEPKPKEA